MVFPVVIYGCESWTVKKAECRRIDAFELWWSRRPLRVPWTARRSNQSILKEINPGISLEGMMLKLNHEKRWTWRNTSWNQGCREKYQSPQICRWHHPNGRKLRGTKEPFDESERGGWKSWLKDGNDNPLCKRAKETQMYRTDFWILWERERVEWFGRMALKHVCYHVRNESPV